ncbi:hypothetical protein JCM10212_004658 [Sporobolomyces blumeae]
MATGQGPRYPSTLAPAPYYQGLEERIRTNLLPTFSNLLSTPNCRTALELAAGDGTHAVVYSAACPDVTIFPTECDEFNVERINDKCSQLGSGPDQGPGKVTKAVVLDVLEPVTWTNLRNHLERVNGQGATFDVVYGHNFVHMIPFPQGPRAIFEQLLETGLVSKPRGRVALYGPFKHDGGYFSEADESFDKMISARPSSYPLGLRSIDALSQIAEEQGWTLVDRIGMPKGNWTLVFQPKGSV